MLKRIHFSLKHHICTLIFRSLLHPHLYLGLWKVNLKNSVTLLTLMVRLKDTLFDFKGLIQIKQSIQEIYMLWRRVWGPSFQNRSPFNLFSPSNSGLQGPPFQPLNIIVCRRFEPSPSMDSPLYGHPPFYIFFQTLHFWQDFYINIAPMKYRINTKRNSFGKIISSFLEN